LGESKKETLIFGGPFRLNGVSFSNFWRVTVSADCSQVYFMYDLAATTHGIARFDRSRGAALSVAAANDYRLSLEPPFKGDIDILQRRPAGDVGYEDVWVVVDDDGHQIAVLPKGYRPVP
jgi:hypothetical protein